MKKAILFLILLFFLGLFSTCLAGTKAQGLLYDNIYVGGVNPATHEVPSAMFFKGLPNFTWAIGVNAVMDTPLACMLYRVKSDFTAGETLAIFSGNTVITTPDSSLYGIICLCRYAGDVDLVGIAVSYISSD